MPGSQLGWVPGIRGRKHLRSQPCGFVVERSGVGHAAPLRAVQIRERSNIGRPGLSDVSLIGEVIADNLRGSSIDRGAIRPHVDAVHYVVPCTGQTDIDLALTESAWREEIGR